MDFGTLRETTGLNPNDLLIYTIPAILFAVVITIYFAFRTYKMSHKMQRYQMDEFRHELELKIKDLSEQLSINKERFEQINHLLLTSQMRTPLEGTSTKLRPDAFLEKMGINRDAKIENDLIFVLTPFNPAFEETFKVIKSVCEEAGFRCFRGDEEKISGEILPHILQLIVKARLIIANITGRNSNVFYELGIAHSIGKQVILISETVEDMPFDIRRIRILAYHDKKDLNDKLKNWLINTFARID